MTKKYVFDLDNTLVYTNKLNGDSYNFALEKFGLTPIKNRSRITRKVVDKHHPFLSNNQKNAIIELKQAYFKENIKSLTVNKTLIDMLRNYDAKDCVLWTSADNQRVESILYHHLLTDSFSKIVYSEKNNIGSDVRILCETFSCVPNQLVVYEDDQLIIKKLRLLQINVIQI